jgi:hypothetical protein
MPYSFAFVLLAGLLLLLAVGRRPSAGMVSRKVCGLIAAPILLLALNPGLWLAGSQPSGDYTAYYALVGGVLVVLVALFGRTHLE